MLVESSAWALTVTWALGRRTAAAARLTILLLVKVRGAKLKKVFAGDTGAILARWSYPFAVQTVKCRVSLAPWRSLLRQRKLGLLLSRVFTWYCPVAGFRNIIPNLPVTASRSLFYFCFLLCYRRCSRRRRRRNRQKIVDFIDNTLQTDHVEASDYMV